MRALFVALLVTSTIAVGQENPRRNTQADFLIGRIVSSIGTRHEIDLGFAHAFKEGERFALFRSERLAWVPVGIVEVSQAGTTTSLVRSTRGVRPRVDDLVLVAYSNIGRIQSDWRDKNFVRREVLQSQYKNGYDTRRISDGAKQLAMQRKNGKRWYRKAEESGLRIIYGTSKAAYASKRVEQLAKQCDLIAELQKDAPASLKSLSRRWSDVLPEITGYEPPQPKSKTDDKKGETESEDQFANDALVKNMLPYVEQEYGNLPRAVRETYAIILGSIAASSPANAPGYIRERLKRTQFPRIASEPDTINRLNEFYLSIPAG